MPRNAVEWLVLAQHYGIATPLLDWTTNPLTALFFACLAQRQDTPGCVLQCSRTLFIDFNEPSKVDPFRNDRVQPGLIDASAMNLRTLAQDSVMSVHSLETATVKLSPTTGDSFVVHGAEKADTLLCLRRFGFSSERLFADLPTAAQEFKASLIRDEVFGVASTPFDQNDDLDTELRSILG